MTKLTIFSGKEVRNVYNLIVEKAVEPVEGREFLGLGGGNDGFVAEDRFIISQ